MKTQGIKFIYYSDHKKEVFISGHHVLLEKDHR